MSAGPKSEFGRYVVPQSRYDMRFFWIGNTVMIRVAQQLLHNGRTNLLANPHICGSNSRRNRGSALSTRNFLRRNRFFPSKHPLRRAVPEPLIAPPYQDLAFEHPRVQADYKRQVSER
jgi:hypothetical protein